MFRAQFLLLLAAQAAAAAAFVAPATDAARPTVTTRLDLAAAAEEELLHRSLLAARLKYEGRGGAESSSPVASEVEDLAAAADDEILHRSLLAAHLKYKGRGGAEESTPVAPEIEAFQSLLRTRRTINEFEPSLPAGWEGSLTRAVAAATYAPNHKRTEPWRFHLLGPEAVRRVCELNAELVTAKKGEAAGQKKLERWLNMSGWLVVTCVEDESSASLDEPTGLARENYAAVCCAAQNLCLSLHAEGLGTKWTTGPVNFDERFGAAAGLPDDEYVVGTMWFGAPVKTPDAPKKRLSIEDVLTKHD